MLSDFETCKLLVFDIEQLKNLRNVALQMQILILLDDIHPPFIGK